MERHLHILSQWQGVPHEATDYVTTWAPLKALTAMKRKGKFLWVFAGPGDYGGLSVDGGQGGFRLPVASTCVWNPHDEHLRLVDMIASMAPVHSTGRRMTRWLRYLDWPLRAKMAVLLVIASLVPLVVAAFSDIREMRQQLVTNTAALLAARGDELAGKLDAFNRSYRLQADRISRLPGMAALCMASPDDREPLRPVINGILGVPLASDPNVRAIEILDLDGRVHTATNNALVGLDLSRLRHVREALAGMPVISDIYLNGAPDGLEPTISYLAPIHGPDGTLIGTVAVSVRATALWQIARASNNLAGPDSSAVLIDHRGVRIAHTHDSIIVFHPAGQLSPKVVDEMVAEQRFGSRTRELLEDVRPFPEQFDRAVAEVPDDQVFHGIASVHQLWNYGVGRRLSTVPWTVFYVMPDTSLDAPIAQMSRQKSLFAGLIIVLALLAGTLFSAIILRPIRALAQTTELIANGDASARVPLGRADELGRLGSLFNAMAERIELQVKDEQQARDVLEQRVQMRTADLQAENAERKLGETRLQAQLARLDLLSRITRAIGERQDMASIFQVVIRSLEDNLPIDFSCACIYDEAANSLTVSSVGIQSETLALELALPVKATFSSDQNGLSRCVAGQLVYEPDISDVDFAFPRRLAAGGLRALVAAPLRVEGKTFGVLIAARRQPHSFSSGECEFLRQLSEHVALAAHHAQLYSTLEHAYDDLRRTQQAVLQQERLRVLGQMASGIAHDINNAISPVMLYTESLLEREPDLSAKARNHLEVILRASEDVAHTVGRMREFYRQQEPQTSLVPVDLNEIVPHVVDLTRARWSDMAQQRGVTIQIRTELAPGLPTIMGIASEVREALTNLVFNAVDAMPTGGTLTIRTGTADCMTGSPVMLAIQQIYVEVVDTGTGMDEETCRRCLEPFFTTKGERGTGLGLAMVYGVAQRHQAEVETQSVVGQGTTMRLRFPIPIIHAATDPVALTPAPLPSLRILAVDDDPILLKSLEHTLKSDGHVLVTANGGQAGIDLFTAAQREGVPFDVVITDLGMPYIDGREVSRSVKGMSPSTPIILLTGWGQRLVAEGDVPPHVDCVLNKPPKLGELRAALARSCGSKRLRG